MQRVERHGHDLDVGRVRDHDLDRGIRVRSVHGERHGEEVVQVVAFGVGLDTLHLCQLDVPVEVCDRIVAGRSGSTFASLTFSPSAMPSSRS